MKLGYRKLGVLLGVVAALSLMPAAADAQFIRYSPIFWSFDGRGGMAIPTGDLADVADAGATFGAGFAYFLNPRLALRVDGNLDLLKSVDGGPADAPDVDVWRYSGGVEIHVTEPSASDLSFTVNLGAGGTTFDSDRFNITRSDGSTVRGATFRETMFSVNGGVRIGYRASRVVTIFASGAAHLAFGDEEDTAFIAEKNGVPPFDTMFIIPIEGGIRINIP